MLYLLFRFFKTMKINIIIAIKHNPPKDNPIIKGN
jgi:hypothetical protein